jgi:hypothetical protein
VRHVPHRVGRRARPAVQAARVQPQQALDRGRGAAAPLRGAVCGAGRRAELRAADHGAHQRRLQVLDRGLPVRARFILCGARGGMWGVWGG